jgi:sigma-B regulation protein RsbU (phosphoserine phosphatase)
VKATAEIRILVAEDDPFFQRVLVKRLKAEGYQVQAASDGIEGMKAIVSYEPDLVISDWMMPHVDGLELCQSVKTGLGESAPYFILLTAKGEISDKLLALDTGADDYLVKPCDQGELMARVRAGLRIVLLTQDMRSAAVNLARLRAEVDWVRADLAKRGIEWPEAPPEYRERRPDEDGSKAA